MTEWIFIALFLFLIRGQRAEPEAAFGTGLVHLSHNYMSLESLSLVLKLRPKLFLITTSKQASRDTPTMPIQPKSRAQKGQEEEEGSSLITRVDDMNAEDNLKYPIPLFQGEIRKPETGWMIVDLVAASPLGSPIIRTFQARDIINGDISVTFPQLRTHSFFNEVRKLLIFVENMVTYESIWDDKILNGRAVDVQNARIVALMDDATIWDGKEILEVGKVVELFEKATDMGLEKLTFFVEWHDSSLFQEISLAREQFRQRFRSTGSRKRLRKTKLGH